MLVSLLWLVMDNSLRIGSGTSQGRDERFAMLAVTRMVRVANKSVEFSQPNQLRSTTSVSQLNNYFKTVSQL